MIDTRFHRSAGPMPLGALLSAAGHADLAPASEVDRAIAGAGDLVSAGPDEIGFAADRRYRAALTASRAGVIVATPELAPQAPAGAVVLTEPQAYLAFVDVLEVLYPDANRAPTPPAASGGGKIDKSAVLEPGVTVGAGAVIGPGCEIGQGTIIGANAVIGPGVAIGRNSIIGAGASLECLLAGDRLVILSGARIGTESFGFLPGPKSARKIPQLGRVVLQDDVQIGANSVIDRGTLGDTVVGEGTKIGNLAQVAHNVRIGRHCMMVGMIGLAGSVTVGDNVMLAGGVHAAGFVEIGEGSIVQLNGVVTKSCPPGSHLAGFPARDVKQWRRDVAAANRLGRRPTSD